MARTAADLREAEELLRRAQDAPTDERLWLLTITWQLLHEIMTDLAAHQAAQELIVPDAHHTALKSRHGQVP